MTEPASSGYRVSPQQRHLWARLTSGHKELFAQSTVLIDGRIDDLALECLRAALGSAVAAHESLRTTFAGLAGRAAPAQVIHEPAGFPLRTVELTGASRGGVGRELDELRAQERAALDPRGGPVFRAALVPLDGSGALLVLTAHALAADRASLRLLTAQIAAQTVRSRPVEGAAPAGPPLQYADFASWHHDLLTTEDSATDREFWSAHPGTTAKRVIPGVTRDGGRSPGAWRTRHVELPAEPAAGVVRLAETLSTDPATVLQAAFRVVTWRLAGEQSLPCALTRGGRFHDELRGAVGAFERDVPLRHEVDHDVPFSEFTRSLGALVAEGDERFDCCDPELLGGLERGAEGLLFGFGYQGDQPPVDQPPVEQGDLTFTTVHQEASASVPFRMAVRRSGQTFRVQLGYDEERIDPAFLDHASEHFPGVLRSVTENPDRAIGDIRVLSDQAEERARELGRGPVAEIPGKAVHDLVTEQAKKAPERIAVSADDEELTYAELENRANQLAHHLVALGVRPGHQVVVSVGRSAALLVGLLGVLKTGAAFVPVDVGYPLKRLEFVVQETATPVLLCTTEVRDRIAASGTRISAETVALDADRPHIAARPAGPTGVPVGPGDLAYVLYTSGTTGQPNGVRVPHRGLVNYLTWCVRTYGLAEGTGSLVHSSVSFDLTLTGLFGPLLAGQRVTLLSEATGVTGLVAALRTARDLSLIKLTPTQLAVVNQLLTPEEVRGSVRTLVVGGEPLRAEDLELFRSGGVRIVNEYGPTETVVGSVAHPVDAHTPHTGPVPIGVPVANTSVHILDQRQRHVPDGVLGELWIGGAGLADGYLDRPELTAQRFVSGLPGQSGERLYRTGDLVRRRADGLLEHLGRVDEQVKIRGVRVEPAEVHSVLASHPAVGQAAVVARRDEDPGRSSPIEGELRLLGYVVPADGAEAPGHAELAAYCRERLPEHFVPSAFVVLDALPVTRNGKLDRAALPKPHAQTRPSAEFVAPRTATEEILAATVSTVLGVERVGVEDNYFVLGGDSIRSVMVASRAQARGVDVTVADLHRYPTVSSCASYLDSRDHPAPMPTTEPFTLISAEDRALMPADVEDAFPLNLLQEGMIFHRDFAAKSAVYHAIASVRLRAPFDLDVMRMAVHQLVDRHPMLRTSFDMDRFSRPLQLVHSEFVSPLHYRDLRGTPTEEQDTRVGEWIEYEKERGFELHEFPLIRFMVHRLEDGVFQFTYGFHHEIVDGWSEALMITELFSHYFSVIYDEPITIKTPTSTMRDAVALELEALNDRRNHEFWDSYLADASLMRLPRPGAGPRADKGDRDIVRITVPVTEELSDGLKRLAEANAAPLKTVLMATHMRVMSAYGGQEDTLSYTVTNGRPESVDGSTAIGLFVNSLALRVRLGGGTWSDLITHTLESERASLPYRRLPMAELKRHQGNEPLAETLFFFTNYHVFSVLDRWADRGVGHVANELYGESTFPFCGIFRLNRETGQLEVRIEYDQLQFSGALMESVRDSYVQVMNAMVADPGGRYDRQDFLAGQDREALRSFTTGVPCPAQDSCLHELVEARAEANPDAPAVQSDTVVLSYGQLNRCANALAHRLRSLGVGAESVVGVLAERSPEQIVSLLAVLKAGGAYLPLDPAQPNERIATLVAASGAAVVVHQRHLAGRLPAGAQGAEVDAAAPGPAARTGNPTGVVTPQNAAYVMYTSGSTGTPKGVLVEHRNVIASLAARGEHYPSAPSRFLLLSSFAFDSSVPGIFWTLTEGGTLILPSEGQQLEPAALLETFARQRPTHTLGIPSLLSPLLEQATSDELSSLGTVIAAGEPCPAEVRRACLDLLPNATFHNEYGPTEATVWSTVYSEATAHDGPQLPVGRPVAGTTVHPRNHWGRSVPLGVSGELCIGGAGVTRGYLGRPSETAAAFLPDPAAQKPGSRVYASGDLGRYLSDGQLEFLGRADAQVKIRGFRVEPGEIEAVLDTHPALRRSIVMARGSDAGGHVLVAYVLPGPGQPPAAGELQQYVRDRLPRYMVPTAVIVLDAVPLTSAGKVDRAALPAPSHAQVTQGRQYTEPVTETEQALAVIWANLLKLDRVGVTDAFFDLGGESLRAMQATAAVNKMFNTRISVRTLFQTPTLGAFAAEVDKARLAGNGARAAGGSQPAPSSTAGGTSE